MEPNANPNVPPVVEKNETNTIKDAREMTTPASAMAQPEKKKNKTGMIAGIVCLALLAVAGLSFGAYAMITKDNAIADAVANCEGNNSNSSSSVPLSEDDTESAPEVNATNCPEAVASDEAIKDFYLVGELQTRRRYYLGASAINPDAELPDYEYYLVDMTKMGTDEVVRKYDMTSIINKIRDEKVNSLPDTLAAEMTNARPKSSCKSYRVFIDDVINNPKNRDWTIEGDWSKLLPFIGYFECVFDGGRMSLGTNFYSLDPDTGDVRMIGAWV